MILKNSFFHLIYWIFSLNLQIAHKGVGTASTQIEYLFKFDIKVTWRPHQISFQWMNKHFLCINFSKWTKNSKRPHRFPFRQIFYFSTCCSPWRAGAILSVASVGVLSLPRLHAAESTESQLYQLNFAALHCVSIAECYDVYSK
jgi:hypothetical protein